LPTDSYHPLLLYEAEFTVSACAIKLRSIANQLFVNSDLTTALYASGAIKVRSSLVVVLADEETIKSLLVTVSADHYCYPIVSWARMLKRTRVNAIEHPRPLTWEDSSHTRGNIVSEVRVILGR